MAELSPVTIRRKGLSILGQANFSYPRNERRAAILRMLGLAPRCDLRVEAERQPMAQIGTAWARQARGPGKKLVLVP